MDQQAVSLMPAQPLTRQYAGTRQHRQAENGTPWPGSAPQTAPPYGRPAPHCYAGPQRTMGSEHQGVGSSGAPGSSRASTDGHHGEIGRRSCRSDRATPPPRRSPVQIICRTDALASRPSVPSPSARAVAENVAVYQLAADRLPQTSGHPGRTSSTCAASP
jgi:hypothetical protein